MSITRARFGMLPDGATAQLFTLTNSSGAVAKLTDYGARLVELHVPDRRGELANVTLGFDAVEKYLDPKEPYFGCTVGRYANRIAGAQFTLDGITYRLNANNGPNTLHGGRVGFDKKRWQAEQVQGPGSAVRFSYRSPDMDEGFPGNLAATVVYLLDDHNELWIEYSARCDKPTIVNLTNHAYFNLAGAGRGSILGHVLSLNARHYTPVDEQLIPTGQIAPVAGTPMDFTQPMPIGSRIAQVPGGYDHNYVLDNASGTLATAARVEEPGSGRVLEIATTQPGIQFYTGNFLDGSLEGNGGRYHQHHAFCLETQHFPDSPHHANFPSTTLRPGQTYRHVARFRFSTIS